MNVNLDSIHRLIEETQIFQMQPSSTQASVDVATAPSSPVDTGQSSFAFSGGHPPATSNFRAQSLCTSRWDICEELRRRELREAQARAAQMEKTMRWWSDCTANWREKWSKVRAERNSAREEARQLRVKLEMTTKELSALRKKQRLSLQQEVSEASAPQDLDSPRFPEGFCGGRGPSPWGAGVAVTAREHLVRRQAEEEDTNSKEEHMVFDPLRVNEEMKLKASCTDVGTNGSCRLCAMSSGLTLKAGSLRLGNEVPESSASQVHLVECQKILWKEREMRAALEKEVERLESALSLWKWKYEELRTIKSCKPEKGGPQGCTTHNEEKPED
uniref:coiled-coil domain-containing protein 102B n=1 Tax=Jaculus jaculus TaxID=51337 RepID=UPI001E1B4065|nr:coiled-coil domain-containing protein 102B [Jaculus jaculus]